MNYFTPKEIAATLKVSVSTVYGLVETGKLSTHRIGVGRGAIRVSEEDLIAFLAASRTESRNGPLRRQRPKLKHLRI